MEENRENSHVIIRDARKDDMVAVEEMVLELAKYEGLTGDANVNAEDLVRDGFERQPAAFRCKVAEGGAGRLVGYALYFPTYSTCQGRCMMLEDLYVRVEQRRRGAGRKLFNAVAREAHAEGCTRLEWHVLGWNEAKMFYESRGAVNMTASKQWCYYRLSGKALSDAAEDI